MVQPLRQATETLRSYLGTTVENVGSEELYKLATRDELQNDRFRMVFYHRDGDDYRRLLSENGREQKISDTLLDVGRKVSTEYSVELTKGRYGGLKLYARTEFDGNYDIMPHVEWVDSGNKFEEVGAVEFETVDSFNNKGVLDSFFNEEQPFIEQFGEMSPEEAAGILEEQD